MYLLLVSRKVCGVFFSVFHTSRAGELAQQANALPAMPEDLSLIPRAHMMERRRKKKKKLLQAVLRPHTWYIYAHTETEIDR